MGQWCCGVGPCGSPLPLLYTPQVLDGAAPPSCCRAQLAPAPAQLSHSGAERRKLTSQCIPWEDPAPQWRGDATRGGHGSSGAPVPRRAVLAWGASCWCGCQGPVRTRPASSRQTCCRHIQCSQGSSSQLLPPTNRSPTWPRSMGATAGHTLATAPCSLPSSPCIAGVRATIPRHCPRLQPHNSHSLTGVQSAGQNLSVQAGPGSMAQHGTAQHGTTLSWLSPWVSASCPTQQVPQLLEPPRPWPAVTGACGGATSTPESCSTLSQGALTAAQTTAPSQASRHRTGWALLAGSSWIQPPSGSAAVGGSPTRHSCQG